MGVTQQFVRSWEIGFCIVAMGNVVGAQSCPIFDRRLLLVMSVNTPSMRQMNNVTHDLQLKLHSHEVHRVRHCQMYIQFRHHIHIIYIKKINS